MRYTTVVEESDEEPIEYVYSQRRSRPSERKVRRYRKIVASNEDSEAECEEEYYYKPSYRKVKTIKYNDQDDYHRRESRKRSKGESLKKLKHRR